jgi:hypothetical protein
MEKFKQQKNRRGEWITSRVDTKARVSTLQFIREKFMDYSQLIPFTLNEYLYEKLSYYDRNNLKEIAKEKERLRRLVRAEWLRKPDKDGKFKVTKKFEEYVRAWSHFDNPSGPLMKTKEKEKIVEKEVRRESKETEREDVVGFV